MLFKGLSDVHFVIPAWTSTHVAMSRQDAIRQLKLKAIADVKTAE